jgi:pSer/pThr/pTyr-binding forkhead associated (FHA) protein
VVTLGRGEDNEIWLDDDLASRHHAELAWDQETIYITDCDSLNGVLLNGQRIRRSAIVEPGALLEIGSHHFLFEKAEEPRTPAEQDDPLVRHVWHSTADLHMENATVPMAQPVEDEDTLRQPLSSDALGTRPVEDEDTIREPLNMDAPLPSGPLTPPPIELQETAALRPVPSTPQPSGIAGMFTIRDGEMAGYSFVLDRPVLTIGRGPECDVAINDVSISRRHAQVLRQANGNYVQDLASRNGTKVNDEPLHAPHLLQPADVVCLGSIRLEYALMQGDPTVPMSASTTPPPVGHPTSGPLPLRLPSRSKIPPS